MKQCGNCLRLLPASMNACSHCESRRLDQLENMIENGFPDYRIDINEIELEGSLYRIDSLINRGGYGTILKIIDGEHRAFALKTSLEFDVNFTNNRVIRPEQVKESSKALFAEIRIFSRMVVNPLLQVFSAGTARIVKGSREIVFPYILMELAGATLKELIEHEAAGTLHLPFEEKQMMITDLLESLRFLHESSLVHRDLSPGNIFVVDRGNEIHYVIGDYGTSKDVSNLEHTSTTSHLITKADYFDPERFRNPNFRYDHRTDIWSAGVIITEIACGNFWSHLVSPEFQTNLRDGMIGFDEIFCEANLGQRLDPKLIRILKKASATQPASRYMNVSQMICDTKRFFAGRPHTFFSSSRSRSQTFTVTIQIKLPLDIEFAEEILSTDYKGNTNFEFGFFCDYDIHFPFSFIFKSAKIKSTTLYSVEARENHLLLRLKKNRFIRRYREFLPKLEHASGYLTLQFTISTRYMQ